MLPLFKKDDPEDPINYRPISLAGALAKVKFLHQNCQSVLGQRLLLKNFLSDLGDNCISVFSETWLKSVNDITFWSLYSKYLMSFRCDRRTDLREKNKGGGILLFVPKKFHPNARIDLETLSKDHFEIVWVDCKINKKPALINLAYCPKKQLIIFLEELALVLDRAATESNFFLLGDYNLNYFYCNERYLLKTDLAVRFNEFKYNFYNNRNVKDEVANRLCYMRKFFKCPDTRLRSQK